VRTSTLAAGDGSARDFKHASAALLSSDDGLSSVRNDGSRGLAAGAGGIPPSSSSATVGTGGGVEAGAEGAAADSVQKDKPGDGQGAGVGVGGGGGGVGDTGRGGEEEGARVGERGVSGEGCSPPLVQLLTPFAVPTARFPGECACVCACICVLCVCVCVCVWVLCVYVCVCVVCVLMFVCVLFTPELVLAVVVFCAAGATPSARFPGECGVLGSVLDITVCLTLQCA